MSFTARHCQVFLWSVLALTTLSSCAPQAPVVDSTPTPISPEPLPRSDATPAKDGTKDELDLSGATIAIDPGHNGANAQHPDKIAREVPDGRGGTKACNTTGTATDSDFPEAKFNWEVSRLLTDDLEAAGAEVLLSREDNDGVGPCVDERGEFADEADLLVSIHANGSESKSVQGFHIIVAEPPRSQKVGKSSDRLATALAKSMGDEFVPNQAYGQDAISRRSDLAGLNNATVPAVIVECGEMRNPDEAELMESADGRARYAQALLVGIAQWY